MTMRATGPVPVMAEQCLARSPRGVVAAAAPTAALIGATMLGRGGNAFDAAVAAALAEGVLLPPKCGLAGDLVALTWQRDDPAPEALLAVGGAPAGLAEVAADGRLELTGPMSVGVPGAPAGYLALAARGRLDLADVARPAHDLAAEGFCWSAICEVLGYEAADLVRRHQPGGCRYYPDGAPPRAGNVVALPGLARAIDRFATDRDAFLAGPVGEAIVARVSAAGGVLTMDDLTSPAAEANWGPAAATTIGGEQLWATPAPTHGPSLLDALARLPAGTTQAKPSPAEVQAAIDDAVAARRTVLTDPGHASGTSMVSAAGADGTLVTVVHSNSFPRFGSGLIAEEYDLILANRAGRGFADASDPADVNFPAPGRRPATTLHAWGWSPSSTGWRVLGATPGGVHQMPWNAQSLARLLGRSRAQVLGQSVLDARDLAESVAGPRWQIEPEGSVTVEEGLDAADVADLDRATGCRSDTVGRWGLRSAMQIVADTGPYRAAAVDPRTVGAVIPL